MSRHSDDLSPSVYPPPAGAMLPPPVPPSTTSSSSHSSGGKRKRSQGDSAVASSTSSSSHFSRRTKQRIAELNNGGACFQCGGGAPDICHVISRKDSSVGHAYGKTRANHLHTTHILPMLTIVSQFGTYIDKGLLTFDHLGDEQNGLPLCPSCHRAYDDPDNPGLMIIPIELDYFIKTEVKDQQSRSEIAQRLGYLPPRVVPTPEMYSEYLKSQNLLPQDASGGLYWRYTLRDYFPVNADKSFIPGLGPFKQPGVWHGAPMAALRRVFQILGDPGIEGIPEEQMEKLWELRKLYSRKITPLAAVDSDAAGASAVIAEEGSDQRDSTAPANARDVSTPPAATTRTAVRGSTEQAQNTHQLGNTATLQAGMPIPKTCTPTLANPPKLLRFGAAATTEVNVQRYLTMMMFT